jgi:RNA polymerase sigma-70 factor, ECF subfamily
MKQTSVGLDQEEQVLGQEVRSLLEAAVDDLPEGYRSVFVLRQVEGLSTTETAEHLELTEEVVKTRLLRARAALRLGLLKRAGAGIKQAFPFLGDRCDRMVERVLARITSSGVRNPQLVEGRPPLS